MECGRKIIYFSVYENGVKVRPAGYMTVVSGNGICETQIFYRGNATEEESRLQPVYVFLDGSVFLGTEFLSEAGAGTVHFRCASGDFAGSGRNIEELEAIYLDGVSRGICMGRTDGKEPAEAACTSTECPEEETIKMCVPHKKKKVKGVPSWLWVILLAGLRKNSGKPG